MELKAIKESILDQGSLGKFLFLGLRLVQETATVYRGYLYSLDFHWK
jgi:hypothetical protein